MSHHCSGCIRLFPKGVCARRGTTFEQKRRFSHASSKQIQCFACDAPAVTVEVGSNRLLGWRDLCSGAARAGCLAELPITAERRVPATGRLRGSCRGSGVRNCPEQLFRALPPDVASPDAAAAAHRHHPVSHPRRARPAARRHAGERARPGAEWRLVTEMLGQGRFRCRRRSTASSCRPRWMRSRGDG